ncbi:sigma-70 family RNA polymerase sigma factor [Microbacterium sp. NPDC056234]|uniref:sigma-70 family RNA polymerase sigma factor n=1 Tax=Microbacterium sp. NPDC056234 TaxID=3345757 RepID=UPI0035DCCE35
MSDSDALAAEFDLHRSYLTAVAYRMLGVRADAEDAVQESWFRLERAEGAIDDLRAWLTRVVSRICLDHLRSRTRRQENPLDSLPDVESSDAQAAPAERAEQVDRVGYALMLVLEQLTPDERLAYVLHDVFGMPFDDVAEVIERSPQAARKMASRARERVRGATPSSPQLRATRAQQREVVDAFLVAAGSGDFSRLLAVLHPDVEFRVDQGPAGVRIVRGAEQVASQAAEFHRFARDYAFEVVELGDGVGVLASHGGVPSSLLLLKSDGGAITDMETRLLA